MPKVQIWSEGELTHFIENLGPKFFLGPFEKYSEKFSFDFFFKWLIQTWKLGTLIFFSQKIMIEMKNICAHDVTKFFSELI